MSSPKVELFCAPWRNTAASKERSRDLQHGKRWHGGEVRGELVLVLGGQRLQSPRDQQLEGDMTSR